MRVVTLQRRKGVRLDSPKIQQDAELIRETPKQYILKVKSTSGPLRERRYWKKTGYEVGSFPYSRDWCVISKPFEGTPVAHREVPSTKESP